MTRIPKYKSSISFKDERIFKIANTLMILAAVVVGLIGIYLLTIGGTVPFIICSAEVIVFILLFYWHNNKRVALSRYIFFVFSIMMTVVGSLFHGEDGGFDYLFFVAALSPVLFFDKRWQYGSLFMLSMIAYFVVKSLYDSVTPLMPLERAFAPYYLNIIISSILIFFGYELFKRSHLKHEQQLWEKNATIEEQRDAITIAKTQLEEVLKLRTAKIEEQNSAFLKYAFLNAHKVRSPLARLQGLLNIADFEDFSDSKKREFYFDQIEKNIVELDVVLREINSILNQNVENDNDK